MNWKTSPYVTMWIHPRQTLKKILQSGAKEGFFILAFFYGLVQALNLLQILSTGQDLSLWMNLILSSILALPIGVLYFYISSFFFYYVGKLIKAGGSFLDVRAAMSWANVTQIISGFITFAMALYFQNGFFMKDFLMQPFENTPLILVTLFLLTQIVLSVWTFVIFVGALAEAQRLSIPKSLLNIALVVIVYIALLFILEKILTLTVTNPIAYIGGIL